MEKSLKVIEKSPKVIESHRKVTKSLRKVTKKSSKVIEKSQKNNLGDLEIRPQNATPRRHRKTREIKSVWIDRTSTFLAFRFQNYEGFCKKMTKK